MVGVVVVVGATTVLKATPRESYSRRLLISRNYGDISEIVSVISLLKTVAGSIKFINDKYCTAFRSRSLLRTLLVV